MLPVLVNRCTRADSSRSTPQACAEWLQAAGGGKGAPCVTSSSGLARSPDVSHVSKVWEQLLDVLSSLTLLLWPQELWLSLGHEERNSGFNVQVFVYRQMSKPAELYKEQKQVSVSPTQSRFQSATFFFYVFCWILRENKKESFQVSCRCWLSIGVQHLPFRLCHPHPDTACSLTTPTSSPLVTELRFSVSVLWFTSRLKSASLQINSIYLVRHHFLIKEKLLTLKLLKLNFWNHFYKWVISFYMENAFAF